MALNLLHLAQSIPKKNLAGLRLLAPSQRRQRASQVKELGVRAAAGQSESNCDGRLNLSRDRLASAPETSVHKSVVRKPAIFGMFIHSLQLRPFNCLTLPSTETPYARSTKWAGPMLYSATSRPDEG